MQNKRLKRRKSGDIRIMKKNPFQNTAATTHTTNTTKGEEGSLKTAGGDGIAYPCLYATGNNYSKD